MEIIIYGAGKYGKCFYHFLKKIGIKTSFFCQTCCDGELYYDGVKVLNIEQLCHIKVEMTVFIAIRDKEVSDYINRQILNLNRSDIHIYYCGDFITENIMNMGVEDCCYCNLCGNRINSFRQRTYAVSNIFIKHRVSGGGGVRENDTCPVCGSRARFRWQYWVLRKHTDILNDQCSVLHIAPEEEISKIIRMNGLCDYFAGDMHHYNTNIHILDVTNIQFRDDYFDYIIMNHVLEHIENEEKAISELKRVIKPGGKLILSFPICADMDTYENPNARTPEERLRDFGQKDHVRLYGKDYKERLEKYGLSIEVHTPQHECSEEEIFRYGFDYDDISLICTC